MQFLLLFIVLSVGILVLFSAFAPSAPVAERLGQLATPMDAPRARRGGRLRFLGELIDPYIKGTKSSSYLDRRLSQAGLAWTPGEFLLACAGLGIVAAVVVGFVTRLPLAGLPAFAVGAVIPYWRLELVARDRIRRMNDQLPEAVLLLSTALKAGNSLLQGLQLLGKQLPEPLAGEIRSTVQEISWGVPFETALTHFKDRVGTVEVEMVVVASLVQRETGGNLSEILANVHEMIRDRIRIRGDVQALTAQGRASAAILTCLPPGLGVVLFFINPTYIRLLFTDPRGQAMLAGAVVMNIVGTLAIRKIVNVKF